MEDLTRLIKRSKKLIRLIYMEHQKEIDIIEYHKQLPDEVNY